MNDPTAAHVRPLPASVRAARPEPWPRAPVITFAAAMLLLLAAGIWTTWFPRAQLSGLPDDPDVLAAAAELRGRVAIPLGSLRLESALTGPITAPPAAPGQEARLDRAERLLDRARRRLGRDARWNAACAVVDLARHRYAAAEGRYRRVLAGSARYPEARLGLGLTLALRAEVERHPLARRRLRLKAIAQWAAVEPGTAEHDEALFDRVLMLERVGRVDEARRLAGAYLARYPAETGVEEIRAIAGG